MCPPVLPSRPSPAPPSLAAIRCFGAACRAERRRAEALDRYLGRRAAQQAWDTHVAYRLAQVNLTRRALGAGVPKQEIYRVMRPQRSSAAEAVILEFCHRSPGVWFELPVIRAHVVAELAPRGGSLGAVRRALSRLARCGDLERHYDEAAHVTRLRVPPRGIATLP